MMSNLSAVTAVAHNKGKQKSNQRGTWVTKIR